MEWVRKILVDQFDGMTRDEAEGWIDDLESHGCESGMVGCLIYYRDTRKVYEDNEDEILSFLEDFEFTDEIKRGDLPCVDQLVNRRVWAAFEMAARGVFEDIARTVDGAVMYGRTLREIRAALGSDEDKGGQ